MLKYQAPSVTTWGTITDLTQGQGMTYSTDDFISCPPQMEEFIGSNGNDVFECDDT